MLGNSTRNPPQVFQFQVFTFSKAVIYYVMKQCFLSTNFGIVEPFNLDYVINVYMPKKGLGSSVFTLKNLAVKIFCCY